MRSLLKAIALKSAITAGYFVFTVTPAQAYQIFFGEDLHSDGNNRPSSYDTATGARDQFLAGLRNIGTEDFEGFSGGTQGPLSLSFPGAGSATLSGGNGRVEDVASGTTDGKGRYGTSGERLWIASAGGKGEFRIDFTDTIGAFGFYGMDIGDYGGKLTLQLNDPANTVLDVTHTVGSGGSTNGSIFYFAVVAETTAEMFTSVSFLSTGSGDEFGFDDMTIGSWHQANNHRTQVSEPGTLAVLGGGLAVLALLTCRRHR